MDPSGFLRPQHNYRLRILCEALVHIEASRVSATIALTPLLTVGIVQLIPMEGITVEPLGVISLLGALLVVSGSITTAVAKKVH
jgi:drug/metabolite transporter (DMT)-like permease